MTSKVRVDPTCTLQSLPVWSAPGHQTPPLETTLLLQPTGSALMNISLKQLRCFVIVAEQQSFTRAAQVLHTTQSAVSTMVRDLEDEVGFRLFDRTTRQVLLSDLGQNFHTLAARLLEEFQAVVRDTADIAARRKGTVKVGATEAAACSVVAPLIRSYTRLFPAIDVQLVVTLVPSMFSALREGEVDLIIGPDSIRDKDIDRSIEAKPLIHSAIMLWCPPTHPLAAHDNVQWKQVFVHDLVIPALDFNTRIVPAVVAHLGPEVAEAASADKASRHPVGNITAAMSLAQAGLGVTFAAEYVRPLATAFGLVGRPLVEPSLERTLMVYTRRSRTPSLAAGSFVAHTLAHIRERDGRSTPAIGA